jgi:hypothetical protein
VNLQYLRIAGDLRRLISGSTGSQPRKHSPHLRTVPFAGTSRGGDAAPVQLGCDSPQASSAARLYGFDDRS